MNDDTSMRRLVVTSLAALTLSACAVPAGRRTPSGDDMARTDAMDQAAGATPADAPIVEMLAGARYALLGELHDNPALHRLRLGWLQRLADGHRFVIAMEQFDAVMQPRLDAARARIESAADDGSAGAGRAERARELAEAAGFSFTGWDWPLYEPVVALALARGLPLIAANLSARETAAIARGGASAVSGPRGDRPAGWTDGDQAEMASAIRDGHCGLLPEAAIAAMVDAQLARDRTMARAMIDAHRASGLQVLLLAGNGHVRADIGVPRHLAELDAGGKTFAVGIGELGAPLSGRFDRFVAVEKILREDPCEALRRRFKR